MIVESRQTIDNKAVESIGSFANKDGADILTFYYEDQSTDVDGDTVIYVADHRSGVVLGSITIACGMSQGIGFVADIELTNMP